MFIIQYTSNSTQYGGRTAYRIMRSLVGLDELYIDEVGVGRAIDHLTCHGRWDGKVGRDVEDLIAQVARVRSPQFAVPFDIPFL